MLRGTRRWGGRARILREVAPLRHLLGICCEPSGSALRGRIPAGLRLVACLLGILARGEAFDYAAVKAIAEPAKPTTPHVAIGTPDLARYDELLAAGGET